MGGKKIESTNKYKFYQLLLEQLPDPELDYLKPTEYEFNIQKAAQKASIPKDRLYYLTKPLESWLHEVRKEGKNVWMYQMNDEKFSFGDMRLTILSQMVQTRETSSRPTRNTLGSTVMKAVHPKGRR